MPPKRARRFTFIPFDNGCQGGRQGHGSSRGAESDEDDQDSMPLVQRRSSMLPQKRKAEATPEKPPKKPAKEPTTGTVKSTAAVAGQEGGWS